MRPLITLLFVILLWSGCRKESTSYDVQVDPELQILFDRFVEEGQKRDQLIDFNTHPVEGIISPTLQASITGQCQHDDNQPNRLLVNESYWRRASAMQREFLVFHELGHCYLNRAHLDDKDSYGICKSIMHSGSSVCRNDYGISTRDTYLDELFTVK